MHRVQESGISRLIFHFQIVKVCPLKALTTFGGLKMTDGEAVGDPKAPKSQLQVLQRYGLDWRRFWICEEKYARLNRP